MQIAGVVGRAELMSAVCYFSALLCYVKSSSLDCKLKDKLAADFDSVADVCHMMHLRRE